MAENITLLNNKDASATYLSKTDAGDTYLTKTSASDTYLSKTDASSTYITKSEAGGSYLPLAGGTMTGAIVNNVGSDDDYIIARRNDTAGRMVICGGSTVDNGAVLDLGGDTGTAIPSFSLITVPTEEGEIYELAGYTDGKLKWGGDFIYSKEKFIAGNNISYTYDNTNGTMTINAKDTTYSNATTSTAGLMSATDKTTLDGVSTTYLPLAGGTMSSNILFSNNWGGIYGADDTKIMQIAGGTSGAKGGSVYCSGQDCTDSTFGGGKVVIRPRNGSTYKDFIFDTDGSLTTSGTIKTSAWGMLSSTVDNARSLICGGTDEASGASLIIKGKSKDSGEFLLSANDGTTKVSLQGNTSGALTWNGNSLVGVKNTPTAGTNITIASSTCSYTRIGNMVYVWGIPTLAAATYSSGTTFLSGLPTAASNVYGTGMITVANKTYRLRIEGDATKITWLDALTLSSSAYGSFTFMYLAQ